MFEVGRTYKRREEIHGRFGGQQQGGIATPGGHPLVFIFTGDHGDKYGYRDEFRPDGTFWYTGEGQVGDMQFVRGNRALRDHQSEGKTLHVFEEAGKAHVRYVGQAAYLGHHLEDRPDLNGDTRRAIVFELELSSPSEHEVGEGGSAPKPPSKSASLAELRRIALEKASDSAPPTTRRAMVRRRSAAVRVYVLRRAAGKCELCCKDAPFRRPKGEPYLEPHHIHRVADGGPDDPRFVAALCPNCHREIHHGEDGLRLNEGLLQTVASAEQSIADSSADK